MRVVFLKLIVEEVASGKKTYYLQDEADIGETGGRWGGGIKTRISKETARVLLGYNFSIRNAGGFWCGVAVTIP